MMAWFFLVAVLVLYRPEPEPCPQIPKFARGITCEEIGAYCCREWWEHPEKYGLTGWPTEEESLREIAAMMEIEPVEEMGK